MRGQEYYGCVTQRQKERDIGLSEFTAALIIVVFEAQSVAAK